MPLVAELIGIALVAYGIWFAARGVDMMWFNAKKDWWRPIRHQNRYPYPVAGILLGVCFALLGLRFALNNVWDQARILGLAGGALFVIVLVAGVSQPRFLHPKWYGELEDRFGKKAMIRIRAAAYAMDGEEWSEVSATDETFKRWVERTAPKVEEPKNRGYTKSG